MRTFSSGGERPFIDGGWRAMQEDHNVILGRLSMEGSPKDIKDKTGERHMESVP